MLDTNQILFKMDEGFDKIHNRLNDMMEETKNRQLTCMARFGSIEQSIAIRTAVNGVTAKAKAEKVVFQSWLVRSALLAVILGIGVILWKIFLGHIDLIAKG